MRGDQVYIPRCRLHRREFRRLADELTAAGYDVVSAAVLEPPPGARLTGRRPAMLLQGPFVARARRVTDRAGGGRQ